MTTTTDSTPTDATFTQFVDFLHKHLQGVEHSSSGGISAEFPDFDLMPQDYLSYATAAFDDPSDANRINCISHLKRAVECEADTFFHLLKIRRRMNFPQKLEVIERLDLMPSRSIIHLNRVRNRVEHDYAVPEIDDLTVYFDLVAGFVAAMEGAIFMLVSASEMDWHSNERDEQQQLRFKIEYVTDDAAIIVTMFCGETKSRFVATADDWDTFIDTLRILFLLIRGAFVVSNEYVRSNLPASTVT